MVVFGIIAQAEKSRLFYSTMLSIFRGAFFASLLRLFLVFSRNTYHHCLLLNGRFNSVCIDPDRALAMWIEIDHFRLRQVDDFWV